MKQVTSITVDELKEMSQTMYEDIVKADVDINKGIVLVDMDMHADGEAFLLEQGSSQADLWGINLHPKMYGTEEFIEFDSMINIRPSQGNPSKDVLDQEVRAKIQKLVGEVVHD